MMATVDMNLVHIYRPPLNPPFRWQKQTASPHTNGRSVRAVRSLSQAALPRNKLGQILESSSQFKPEIVATLNIQHDELQVERRNNAVRAQDIASSNYDPTNSCDESDDDLPLLEELSRSTWPPNTSTKASKTERSLQHPDKSALDATGTPIDHTEPRSSGHQGDNRGSRDLPVIIEDNELDSKDEAEAASDDVDTTRARRDASPSSTPSNQDPAFESSAPERWYDVEAGCYIDEELPPDLEPEVQEGMTTSAPAQDHPPSPHHDNGRNTQHTLEEPAPRSLPELLVEDCRGGSYDNVSKMERDLLLALEEYSATTPSSPQPSYLYTEPSHLQIDQEHSQNGTSQGRSKELGYRSPPRNQDQDEGEPEVQQQQQQQQEVAAEAMREEEGDNYNKDRERRGEKQRHQDEAEESSSIHHPKSGDDSHDTSSEDDEDPRPAKRRKLRSASTRKGLTPQPQKLTPPSTTQLEVTLRCDDQPESQKSSSPSPTDDKELTANASAAYQEWPMRGFFKLIAIGNEVRYGMEFSLEDVQQLCAATFPLHTSLAGSNASFSARPSRRAQTFSAYAPAGNAPSQSKRPRFTEEEEAKLVDLKERKGWSWEDIQRSFPGRSTGSLQVRYSTKLKERNTAP